MSAVRGKFGGALLVLLLALLEFLPAPLEAEAQGGPAISRDECEALPMCPGERYDDPDHQSDGSNVPPPHPYPVSPPVPKPKCAENASCGCPDVAPEERCKPRTSDCNFKGNGIKSVFICGMENDICKPLPVTRTWCGVMGQSCPASVTLESDTQCGEQKADCCKWNSPGQLPRRVKIKEGLRKCVTLSSQQVKLACEEANVKPGQDGIAVVESSDDPCRKDPNGMRCGGYCNVVNVSAANGCKVDDSQLTGEKAACVLKRERPVASPYPLDAVLSSLSSTSIDADEIDIATELLLPDATEEKVDCAPDTSAP